MVLGEWHGGGGCDLVLIDAFKTLSLLLQGHWAVTRQVAEWGAAALHLRDTLRSARDQTLSTYLTLI